ncbi:hypothetical protein HIM_01981 [Hirsutella minnesotensis 3608]|nr:hypothetical protein HIM_01981 [Hirsutella minnesotensis 3608]
MTYSLYDASIVVAQDAISTLKHLVGKAKSQPNAGELLQSRLHPDMKPFAFQVWCATDLAQKLAKTLSGRDADGLPEDLASWADVDARIELVEGVLAGVDRAQVDAPRDTVPLPVGALGATEVTGLQYAQGYALPNIYFHVVTAYGILRKEGVELGKANYLKPFLLHSCNVQGQVGDKVRAMAT